MNHVGRPETACLPVTNVDYGQLERRGLPQATRAVADHHVDPSQHRTETTAEMWPDRNIRILGRDVRNGSDDFLGTWIDAWVSDDHGAQPLGSTFKHQTGSLGYVAAVHCLRMIRDQAQGALNGHAENL